jgi:hypothetical protein
MIEEELDWLGQTPKEERPEKTLVVILTDGEENSSQHYSSAKIKEMITEMQEAYGWAFVFLAADQDAFAAATNMGIYASNTLNWSSNSKTEGVTFAYNNMAAATTNYFTSTDNQNLINNAKSAVKQEA